MLVTLNVVIKCLMENLYIGEWFKVNLNLTFFSKDVGTRKIKLFL
jgi:hypothetical protein